MINTIDFETEAIMPYPGYPPKPVGVSIWHHDAEHPRYLSWGHPTGNNSTFEEGKRALAEIWDKEALYHNGRFDTEVARVHMGLKTPKDPLLIHDTLFLNFLYDAHADTLSLKPSALRILGIPPDEQEELRLHLAAKGFAGKEWGAHISKADGDITGRYANGDTYRTRKLFEALLDHVNKNGMLAAYRREQRLAPILNQNESDGIRIDLPRLQQDLEKWEKIYERITSALTERIGSCNPDSAGELASALIASGSANEADFSRTPTGRLSTSKESIGGAVKATDLRAIMAYRGALKTTLTTFMRPWERIASECHGRVHPQFNQVRGETYGTRTGRLSSSNPNFQNVPTEFSDIPPEGYPPLPFMRRYVLPDEGHVLVASDFNGQEMRIMAHFAEGRAADIYRTQPRADFHEVAAQLLKEEAKLVLDRKKTKITGFSLIYGSGIGALAEQLHVDRGTAANIIGRYFDIFPEFKELMADVESRGYAGLPVKTWGNRLIYTEAPKMIQGRMWRFEYKLLNHLIQGSAGDQCKEAINLGGYKTRYRRFLITVHDENVYSVNPDNLKTEVAEIKASMEDQPGWDVPFRAEVEVGPNWWDLEKYE